MIRFLNLNEALDGIKAEVKDYEKEIEQIFQWYANQAVLYFIAVQTSAPAETKGAFWTNHTFKAARAFYTKVIYITGDSVRLIFTYEKDPSYTRALEYDFDERFAALPTMLARFAPMVIKDLKTLFGDE